MLSCMQTVHKHAREGQLDTQAFGKLVNWSFLYEGQSRSSVAYFFFSYPGSSGRKLIFVPGAVGNNASV